MSRIPREDYPETVAEVITDQKYKKGVLTAVKRFAKLKPWRGTTAERAMKFFTLHRLLCEIYDINPSFGIRIGEWRAEYGDPYIPTGDVKEYTRGNGVFYPGLNRIELLNKLSVVTYLHEFAHALGRGEQGAAKWSINLFRRCFPRSYSACSTQGHLLVREE